MVTKYGLTLAFCLGLIAVLYQVEVLTTRWQADDFAILPSTSKEQLWVFLASAQNTHKWFMWASKIQEVDARPLSIGKRFEVVYSLPIYGNYYMPFQVVELVHEHKLVIESDHLLKPRFTMLMEKRDEHLKLSFSLLFRRNSALYRCTIGPIMWFLSSQQLRQSLFLVKMLFQA